VFRAECFASSGILLRSSTLVFRFGCRPCSCSLRDEFNHRGDVVSLLVGHPTIHGPEEFDKVKALALAEKVERAAFVVTVSSFGEVNFIGGAQSS